VTASAAERLVQPLGPWLWVTTLPVRLAERSRRPSLTAANGQFLVVRRSAYARAGGHGAVRGDVIEDVALARAVKRAGGRAVPVDGSRLAACRMYDGWPALRAGYAKSLWASVGGSPGAGVAVAAGLTAVWVLPALAALRGSRAGLVGYAAGVAGRAVSAAARASCLSPSAARWRRTASSARSRSTPMSGEADPPNASARRAAAPPAQACSSAIPARARATACCSVSASSRAARAR